MSVPPFPYRPLAELNVFRILHVQPSPDRPAPITSTIEHTSLSKYEYDILSPYTALSCVWGNDSDQRIIQVDSQPFAATKNLHDALACLRDDKKILSIWADAICIDQLNISERNSQVTQMGRIYSSASHTIIFLDSSSQDLEIVTKGIRKICDQHDEISDDSIQDCSDLLFCFERVLSRPWFYRVWILQELVLSRDPFIQYGTTRIRWNDFCKLGSELIRQRQSSSRNADGDKDPENTNSAVSYNTSRLQVDAEVPPDHGIGNDFQVLKHISNARNSHFLELSALERSRGNKLSDLVQSRRGFGASDPRDVIYAHIGLASK